MKKYDHKRIEERWQKKWEEQKLHLAQDDSSKEKLYILDMYPYPSSDGLHVGHVEGYTATDIYARYKRMQGFNVLHPMGWDAFGLPAENYAIKTGVHPKDTTGKAIDNFRRQIKSLGLSYDWTREIGTHTPEYYKWTQWFFLLLYKNGLAYKKKAAVNWCDSCKTVLAHEQVAGGLCERCKNEVVQKELEQWFFKITDFAEELISGLDTVDWPQSTVTNQKNWIGKSEGSEISFNVSGGAVTIKVFTTRPDTLFGATYLVLSPEYEHLNEFLGEIENKDEVVRYIEQSKQKTRVERTEVGSGKTGIELKGIRAVNPANKEEIPIFVADYVLAEYGTGAIMAVPAHDERDYAFAKEFNLPVIQVVEGGDTSKEPYSGEGKLTNSGTFDGMESSEARQVVTKFVEGAQTISYKLRDWLVSRQRYWGAPIPIVYDPDGMPHEVPEEHLPWILPSDVEFKPTGTSPLSESKELFERTEKVFGKGWKPEVDTMDTFVCSSWYFFRFVDPQNKKEFADKKRVKDWLPVDLYVGGAEHTVLHLMYARFFTKVLQKLGLILFSEPFMKLRHQGIVLAHDGVKMSKSRGNVVSPDEVVTQFGADTARLYEMFMGPFEQQKPWQTEGIIGPRRFLEKVWRLNEKVDEDAVDNDTMNRVLQYTIKKVGSDIETLDFNTAVSQLMICANEFDKCNSISPSSYKTFLILLAPFAPHITEEIWSAIGETNSIHSEDWPLFDPNNITQKTTTVAVQVNGKMRASIEVSVEVSEDEVTEKALALPGVQKWIEGGEVKKTIYVKDRLINFVV
jgi:leucyl-tRNA synthetase|tara:strand:+ start:34973 stop:37357 length:2385 start_codon:yes stop_codon:yes gene_type:complete